MQRRLGPGKQSRGNSLHCFFASQFYLDVIQHLVEV